MEYLEYEVEVEVAALFESLVWLQQHVAVLQQVLWNSQQDEGQLDENQVHNYPDVLSLLPLKADQITTQIAKIDHFGCKKLVSILEALVTTKSF